MSTNSTITIKTEDNKFKSIYGHWDGNPEGVGQDLKDFYTDKEKVLKLIELGNFSSLYKSIDCPTGHSFNCPAKDCTVFYGRDRGEKWQEAQTSESLIELKKSRQEYNYFADLTKEEVEWKLILKDRSLIDY